MSPTKDREISTDVLVIGVSMAGCFAAIKAREAGTATSCWSTRAS